MSSHRRHGTEWSSVSIGILAKPRRAGAWAYLNMPPITKPKKITTAAKSSPPTILFLMAPPRRAIGLLG